MSAPVPDYATHYHLADRSPFLNLSDLESADLDTVIADLAERRKGGLKRVFGLKYMEMRRLTEARMRALFVESGGRPCRQIPHYFCLGSCEWFRGLAPDMRALVIPLSALPDEVTSFTYPDSFTAMGFGPMFGLPYIQRPYHNRVFRLSQLADVIGECGLPDTAQHEYEGYWRKPFERYIEIQVWSDEPVGPFMLGLSKA